MAKEYLIWEELNWDKPDNDSQIPGQLATSSGYKRVVKLYTTRQKVTTDKQDNHR